MMLFKIQHLLNLKTTIYYPHLIFYWCLTFWTLFRLVLSLQAAPDCSIVKAAGAGGSHLRHGEMTGPSGEGSVISFNCWTINGPFLNCVRVSNTKLAHVFRNLMFSRVEYKVTFLAFSYKYDDGTHSRNGLLVRIVQFFFLWHISVCPAL